jgi:hypothetical protein
MRRYKWTVFLAVLAVGGLLIANAPIGFFVMPSLAASPVLASQTRSEGGVRVKVTPKNITVAADTWDFEVALNTHSVALDQDLAKTTVLVDAQGKEYLPMAWEGDPPGGHHRGGVLRFKPLAVLPSSLELRINGVGGIDARVFRWQLQ